MSSQLQSIMVLLHRLWPAVGPVSVRPMVCLRRLYNILCPFGLWVGSFRRALNGRQVLPGHGPMWSDIARLGVVRLVLEVCGSVSVRSGRSSLSNWSRN